MAREGVIAMTYEDWVKQQVDAAARAPATADSLGNAMQMAEKRGLWLEFGVYEGNTLRRLVANKGGARAIGFDSFKGLPETGPNGWNKGLFACDPPVVEGAQIVVGLFEDVLPTFPFADAVTLVHVDCDLYASARCALKHVRHALPVGAIICFDEVFGYEGFEGQELRALYETMQDGLRFEWACRGNHATPATAAIRVLP